MLKVLSDAYSAADAGDVTLLCLLDLSAAFDSVDHQILIERLQRTFGCSRSSTGLAVVVSVWTYTVCSLQRCYL